MKNLTFILSMLIVSTHSFTQEWKTLDEENYLIEYPENWEVNTSGAMNTKVILFSPIVSKEDLFRENVNYIIQDLSEYKVNLDQYVEASEKQIETLVVNGKILESERLENKNGIYHKLIYTGTQGLFDLQFMQYFFVKDNIAYVLTFTCEIDQVESYQKTGERILNSFLLK